MKLLHVLSEKLKDLEAQVEKLGPSVQIISVNNVSGTWYAHYVVGTPQITKTEVKETSRKGK